MKHERKTTQRRQNEWKERKGMRMAYQLQLSKSSESEIEKVKMRVKVRAHRDIHI